MNTITLGAKHSPFAGITHTICMYTQHSLYTFHTQFYTYSRILTEHCIKTATYVFLKAIMNANYRLLSLGVGWWVRAF